MSHATNHATNHVISHEESQSVATFAPPHAALSRVQTIALVGGVIGIIATLILSFLGGAFGLKQFFHAYLSAYIFWVGVTLGCLGWLMLQFVARGAWGVTIRRVLEAGTKTLPLMAILFVPVILGIHPLYHWAENDALFVAAGEGKPELIQLKGLYLDAGWFVVRFVIFFVIWGGLAFFINRWSAAQDREPGNPYYGNMMRNISGPGIVFFALTVTFASVDWVMSLDPEWFSTIFGILFVGGWALSAISFVVITMILLSKHEPFNRFLRPMHFHDLGKLLLALTMLWTYFSISQLLIIWSGNLPEEIPWFLRRMRGGWGAVSILIVLFHFAVPFLVLLSRRTKRDTRLLLIVAGLLFFMRMIDASWLVMPQEFVNHAAGRPNTYVDFSFVSLLTALAAVVAIGGVWIWFYIYNLKKMPLMPIGDPLLERALTHGGEEAHH